MGPFMVRVSYSNYGGKGIPRKLPLGRLLEIIVEVGWAYYD